MYPLLKRALDIIISITIILILFPLLIIVVIFLLVTGEGEVFYHQKRVGYKNKPFSILKFATMLKESPNMGTGSITLRNDPRVTRVGRYLRISKINELPQIINILVGDMTLVGPRPHMEIDFNLYPREIQKEIFNIKPGITGIGSIVFRDQEQIFTDAKTDPHKYYKRYLAPYKGLLEIWYQKNMSFWIDVKIIFSTIFVVFFSKSEIAYKIFKDIPPKPYFPSYEEMTEEEKASLS